MKIPSIAIPALILVSSAACAAHASQAAHTHALEGAHAAAHSRHAAHGQTQELALADGHSHCQC